MQHPFHYQCVQSLNVDDYQAGIRFCCWLLDQHNNNDFINQILFTDESTFTRNGIFNFHNYHYWMHENPHAVRRTNFQQRFSVNVWDGTVNNLFIEMLQRLNGISNSSHPTIKKIISGSETITWYFLMVAKNISQMTSFARPKVI